MVEGPVEPGDKVLVVEDTVTTGGSTVEAIERIREQGLEIVGARGASSTGSPAAARRSPRQPDAPYEALTTIDDVYPERPGPLVADVCAGSARRAGADGVDHAPGDPHRLLRGRLRVRREHDGDRRESSRRRTITETRWSTPSRDVPVPYTSTAS